MVLLRTGEIHPNSPLFSIEVELNIILNVKVICIINQVSTYTKQ